MKNKTREKITEPEPVKSGKRRIFGEKETCPVCGRKYIYLKTHMRNMHRPLPSFRLRFFFWINGLKHIFLIQTSFIFIYFLPFSGFAKETLFIILAVLFAILYAYLLYRNFPDSDSDSLLTYSHVQGIIFFTCLIFIDYLNAHDSVSEMAANYIRGMFSALTREKDFPVPSAKMLLFFLMPAVWTTGCISWEISILRKKLKGKK